MVDRSGESGAAGAAAGQVDPGSPRRPNHPPRTALERSLLAVLDHTPGVIFLKDTERRYLFVNQVYLTYGAHPWDRVIGSRDEDFMPPDVAAKLRVQEDEVLATGRTLELEEEVPTGIGVRHFLARKFLAYDEDGVLLGIGGVITDITERKLREAEQLAEQQRVIESQRDTLRELSTPLLPIAEGVLAVPLIGALGPRRTQELLEALLHGIAAQRARVAILDVTGIRELDAEVATGLTNAARAARLVGAEVVLTGISPAVARVLVELGADLAGIKTLATLASGIAHALGR